MRWVIIENLVCVESHRKHLLFRPSCLHVTYTILVSSLDVSDDHLRLIIYVVNYQIIHLLSSKVKCHISMCFCNCFR
jgi:hypothetical protein